MSTHIKGVCDKCGRTQRVIFYQFTIYNEPQYLCECCSKSEFPTELLQQVNAFRFGQQLGDGSVAIKAPTPVFEPTFGKRKLTI